MKDFKKPFLIKSLGFNEAEAKQIMDAQKKFPEILANDGKGHCVDGRTLYGTLEVVKDFSTWMKSVLDGSDAVELEDFSVFFKGDARFTDDEIREMSPQKRSSYGITEEYSLTLEIAKEIAMFAGASPRANAKLKSNSKICRKYFILMDKAVREQIQWDDIRFPQKKGFTAMTGILQSQYRKTHDGREIDSREYPRNADMLNICLFGIRAKDMRAILEVEYSDLTRDSLTQGANKALAEIQSLNSSLILSNLDFEIRESIIQTTCDAKFSQFKNSIKREFAKELKIAT